MNYKNYLRENKYPLNSGWRIVYCQRLLLGVLLLMLAGVLTGCGTASKAGFIAETSANTQPAAQVPGLIPTATPSGPLPGPATIYVLDSNPLAVPSILASVVSVDRPTGKELAHFTARARPAAGLSPDGRYLYIVDFHQTGVYRGDQIDALAAIDTQTHDVLWEVVLPSSREYYLGYPFTQEVWSSPDGLWVYVLLGAGRFLKVDAATGTVAQDINTGWSCNRSWNLWRLGPEDLVAVCHDRLNALSLATGEQGAALTLPLPSGNAQSAINVVGGSLAAEAGRLYLVVSEWDPQSFQWWVIAVDDFSNGGSAALLGPLAVPDGWKLAPGRRTAASADGRFLYVGASPVGSPALGQGVAEQVWIYDTTTWERTGTVIPKHGVFHLVLSSEGNQLYTVNPKMRSFSVLDIVGTNTLSEVKVIENLKYEPGWIISR